MSMAPRRYFHLLIAAICFFTVPGGVFAQPKQDPILKVDLWIDPRFLHLDHPHVEQLFEQLPFERVILYSFVGGTTLVPTKNTIFPQMEYYKGKEEVIRKTVARLRARKIKVYAGFDCFRWFDSEGPDIFKKFPGLVETAKDGSAFCFEDKFGSAFNPKARNALKDLASDVAENIADFDGVLFCPQLGRQPADLGGIYGYSRAAEKILFDETGLDLDEVSAERGTDDNQVVPKDPVLYRKWKDWRQEKVVTMLQELKKIFEAKMKKPRFALLAYSDFYHLDLWKQNESLEDSVEFLRRVGFDDVVMEVDGTHYFDPKHPNTNKGGRNYQELREKLAKQFPAVSSALLIQLVGANFLDSAMKSIVGRTADRVLLRVGHRPEDLEQFDLFKTRYDEYLRFILPRKDLRDLELDPRLQVPVAVAGNENSSLVRQFEDLKAQVGISFGLKNAHAATKYTGGVGGHEAWVYMQHLAVNTDVKGRWEKNRDGYDFIITWPLAEPEKKAPMEGGGQPVVATGFGYLWLVGLIFVILATLGGVIVIVKRAKKQ